MERTESGEGDDEQYGDHGSNSLPFDEKDYYLYPISIGEVTVDLDGNRVISCSALSHYTTALNIFIYLFVRGYTTLIYR
ncbi:hypothetical protein Y032_0002g1035 [Ancylostoma ceylanicum]|uniref:Uncharacterized protein n=1 Tax=Ancylostoma ceylanicum TaxID=53326 RepID=A0A016W0Z5_9BILA|nr:hypothetical protein Y032_0002g1035 [Ancylostoma ceylanicum]